MAQGQSTKIISTIKWIRTSRLSIKNAVSASKVRDARRDRAVVSRSDGRPAQDWSPKTPKPQTPNYKPKTTLKSKPYILTPPPASLEVPPLCSTQV